MKNITAKIDYWMTVEIVLWIMTGLWLFLGVVGFITLSAEETMSCMDWFVRMIAAAVLVKISREGIF